MHDMTATWTYALCGQLDLRLFPIPPNSLAPRQPALVAAYLLRRVLYKYYDCLCLPLIIRMLKHQHIQKHGMVTQGHEQGQVKLQVYQQKS
eukprot:756611-Hanusia_phi.AAC.2